MRRKWTAEEESYMRLNYATSLTRNMAAYLQRREPAVYEKAQRMGLFKDQGFLSKMASIHSKTHPKVRAAGFKKGSVPVNKGKKSIYYGGGFEKGHVPYCVLPAGSLRVHTNNDHILIKMDDNNRWEQLGRYTWFVYHGEWPSPDHVIWHKNRDVQDTTPDNMELITKAEHLLRISMHNLPPEVVAVLRVKGSITKELKKHVQQYD
jgi:hypothetical protein